MTAQCTAITNAMSSKGYDTARLAKQTGLTTDRIDAILSGSSKPSQQEFKSIGSVLGISSDASHVAQVSA
ncbi:hypothetical protein EV363DRAFT_1398135 [Boletus edulis]|nr:hypothetical protein EV363DRAFT_1398135 [Boletus edulis]